MTVRRRRRSAPPETQLLHIDGQKSGRALALLALQQHDETGRFLSELFSGFDREYRLSTQERAQAVDIASGTIRRRRAIDLLLQSQVKRPRAEVEPDLWRILQTGVQQLVFGKTPDHAAVDATVELTRSLGQHRWAGFVNGVLRNVGRLLTEDTAEEPAARHVPLLNGKYRVLTTDVFSCPLTKPVDYFGEAFSMPRAIARRWHSRFSWSDLLHSGFYCLQPPQICLRVNRTRSSAAEVTSALQQAGVTVEPARWDESLRLQAAGRIEALPGYHEGLWSIQDESAMAAARLLDPQPGEEILDLCAAPGGKTTHLAELSADQAIICGTDVTEDRVDRVLTNADRLQLESVRGVLIERDGTGIPDGPFDAVLVDVPCSNTGVLSRRPEARWRFREADLSELVQLQTRLLMTAFDHVRPGGRVVYSTCSVEPEETSELIRTLVAAVPAMTLVSQQLQQPGHPADGAYTALLHRQDTAAPPSAAPPQDSDS